MMDYKKILHAELKREQYHEFDTYEENCSSKNLDSLFSDHEFLLKNIPTEQQVVETLKELIENNDERSVMLVPIRSYLQTRLLITAQRLDDLITDNEWIHSWIEQIKALQEIRIMEMFSAGNMEDSKLKWLLWAILGEPVDLSTSRASVSMDAEATLISLNRHDTDR